MAALYLVPTPIGNLSDISERARKTLEAVDFIAAEDTRVSLKLLTHFDIRKPLLSCHGHNEAERSGEILRRIAQGENCAYVSDAGTPGISDPGMLLVEACAAAGIDIIALPGPCAAICALSASGLETGRFCFEGFLSMNKKKRREHLNELLNERRTMIFYEAPHKLPQTLRDLRAAFGDRRVVLARELTKIHEEYIRTTLERAAGLFSEENPPRGEFVIILQGAPPSAEKEDDPAELDLSKGVREVLREAKKTGVSRNAAYRAALEQKKTEDDTL